MAARPFDLWHQDRAAFEHYQAHQLHSQRAWFERRYWAVFAGERDGRTLFLGLYETQPPVRLETAFTYDVAGTDYEAGAIDCYNPLRLADLAPYEGRVYIDWGAGNRAWRQRAEKHNKAVTELYAAVADAPFPGHMALNAPVSMIAAAPGSWREHLSLARGVYLLTCPRTGEHYVGSASGAEGFWGRWMTYEANGHGGNVAMIPRERSDWIASILQVAGSADTRDDILAAEALWTRKLGTRNLGLNRN